MKLISWNINGFRSLMNRTLLDAFARLDADVYCLQETKLQAGQGELDLPGFTGIWNYADRPGYSGTAVFVKNEPLNVTYGLGIEEHDNEGRVITLEYPDFYFVTVYTPNSQNELKRLDYRMTWEDAFLAFVKDLDAKKPVIVCGDLNVAHKEIDIKHPKANRKNAGFSDEERACMTRLLENGFVDTFRHFYPEKKDAYSWWSYLGNARANNSGWRIDYFLVSERMIGRVADSQILSEVLGSDHCPVLLHLKD